MTQALQAYGRAAGNAPLLYVTDEDITGLPAFSRDTLFAVRAPPSTMLEVPDPEALAETTQGLAGRKLYR